MASSSTMTTTTINQAEPGRARCSLAEKKLFLKLFVCKTFRFFIAKVTNKANKNTTTTRKMNQSLFFSRAAFWNVTRLRIQFAIRSHCNDLWTLISTFFSFKFTLNIKRKRYKKLASSVATFFFHSRDLIKVKYKIDFYLCCAGRERRMKCWNKVRKLGQKSQEKFCNHMC